jgi:hypothetical protein
MNDAHHFILPNVCDSFIYSLIDLNSPVAGFFVLGFFDCFLIDCSRLGTLQTETRQDSEGGKAKYDGTVQVHGQPRALPRLEVGAPIFSNSLLLFEI